MAILRGLIVARILCGNYAPEGPPGRVVLHKRLLAENYGKKKMGKNATHLMRIEIRFSFLKYS